MSRASEWAAIPLRAVCKLRWPRIPQVLAGFSLLGLTCCFYFMGAAAMYFDLPTSNFLQERFLALKTLTDSSGDRAKATLVRGDAGVIVMDRADKTYDGLTLITTTQGSQARLVDMRGHVTHQWQMPFRQAWPGKSTIQDPLPETQIHWARCHLFDNGDLLAVYQADGASPAGYGLVKLDRNSKLLWAYSGTLHHDLDVDEDGNIYVSNQRAVNGTPDLMDFLTVLSPEGRELASIPILEALRTSPYSLIMDQVQAVSSRGDLGVISVKVLRRATASAFPLFKPGQVLLSLQNLNALVVLDPGTGALVWASAGRWQRQRDAEFLENGHLLIYENIGRMQSARLVEYDPVSQALPWWYCQEHATPVQGAQAGMKQRLPNGNTLMVVPTGQRLIEVTAGKEIAWEFRLDDAIPDKGKHRAGRPAITGASRHRESDLTFLNGGSHARP